MANFVFGVALGRVGEYVNRVLNNDPANSILLAIPMSQSGTAEQGEALTDFAAVEADANFAEQTAASWGRKTISDSAGGLTWTFDATNNKRAADMTDLVWTAPVASNNTTGLIIAYDPDSTTGTDSTVIPLVHLDMAVTADGNQVTFQFNNTGTAGWYTALRT